MSTIIFSSAGSESIRSHFRYLGSPGSGKTATVHTVVKELKQMADLERQPPRSRN